MALTLFPKLATLALAVLISAATVTAQTTTSSSEYAKKKAAKLVQLQKQKLQKASSVGIQSAPEDEIETITIPFKDDIYFDEDTPCYDDDDPCIRIRLYEFTLKAATVLAFNTDKSMSSALWSDDDEFEYDEPMGHSVALAAGTYTLLVLDDAETAIEGSFEANILIVPVITKSAFNAKLDFDDETPEISVDGSTERGSIYQFTLKKTSLVNFNSNQEDGRVQFELYKDILLYDDYVDGGYNFSKLLEAGTYYLAIYDKVDYEDYSANIRISAVEIKEAATFSFTDISLPFSESLYFRPGYNARENSDGLIEKGFKLVLTEKTKINYESGCIIFGWDGICTGLKIYTDQALTQPVWDSEDSEPLVLAANTYYLVFDDGEYYSDREEYGLFSVKLEQTPSFTYQPISSIPHSVAKLDFTPEAGAIYYNRAYFFAFSFTLAADATVYFFGMNEDLDQTPFLQIFNAAVSLDEDEDDLRAQTIEYDRINDDGFEVDLEAGTYYILLTDDRYYKDNGKYFSTYFEINTTGVKPTVDMPSDIEPTFTITFNSNGGSAVAPLTVDAWEKATAPTAPTKTGTTFVGWYNGSELWNFAEDFVIGNITLTAVWANETLPDNPLPIRKPQIAVNGVKAYTQGNSIMLQNVPQNAKVQVYNLNGKQVYSANSSPNMSIELQTKGMYVVKVGKQALRVTIR